MRTALLTAARAYAKATKQPLRRVSKAAYGDSRFFEKLARTPSGFTAAKFDEVMAWFADASRWPGGVIPVGAVLDIFAVPQGQITGPAWEPANADR